MPAMEDECWDGSIQAHAFVEILLRIPPSARQRLRLVCRHWRDVVDEHLPARRRAHSKVLAYVSRRPQRSEAGGCAFHVIGTCNGLLCLCCYNTGIVLFNPTTGEKLVVELPPFRLPQQRHAGYSFFTFHPATGLYKIVLVVPGTNENSFDEVHVFTQRTSIVVENLSDNSRTRSTGTPRCRSTSWHEAYSFAYHPTTGKYKILHLPCCFDRTGHLDRVQVLTLGESVAAWRDVPAPAACASCCLKSGIVSVDGATYWINEDTDRIVAFDLDDERITPAVPLPVAARPRGSRYLTEVRGRLGVVDYADLESKATVEVRLGARGRSGQAGVEPAVQRNVEPEGVFWLYGHAPQTRRMQCSEARVSEQSRRVALTGTMEGVRLHTFAYVETRKSGAQQRGLGVQAAFFF
ncbi:hypothetical protein PR202_gb02813 [Eleusine coracana subsp. coracana]|uniref:F-box domain-containing protein n=1 Tax=Eleusine coracana subsp. coracana TaxID=191504 RepID=A0AAV5DY06_ELECO|nr:hypothetical protein PR202_gb02813 [Eleusine coracana subsp. coracana]